MKKDDDDIIEIDCREFANSQISYPSKLDASVPLSDFQRRLRALFMIVNDGCIFSDSKLFPYLLCNPKRAYGSDSLKNLYFVSYALFISKRADFQSPEIMKASFWGDFPGVSDYVKRAFFYILKKATDSILVPSSFEHTVHEFSLFSSYLIKHQLLASDAKAIEEKWFLAISNFYISDPTFTGKYSCMKNSPVLHHNQLFPNRYRVHFAGNLDR